MVNRRLRLTVVRDPEAPTNRSECRDGCRPCPFVACRYHLFLDVATNGKIWKNFAADEHDEDSIVAALMSMPETCALDVADRGAHTEQDVARVLGTGINNKNVFTSQASAIEKLRVLFADNHPEDTYIALMAKQELKKR